MDGATYTANIQSYSGGVGRNIAEGIAKIYGKGAYFFTALGDDQHGQFLEMQLPNNCKTFINIDKNYSTANCSVIFDRMGDCKLVVGNMEIHSRITPAFIKKHESILLKSPLVVIDANLSLPTMETILTLCSSNKIPVFFEPTDMRIANKPFKLPKELYSSIKFISPNLYELRAIAQQLGNLPLNEKQLTIEEMSEDYLFKEVQILLDHVAGDVENIILTLGKFGCIIKRKADSSNAFFDSKVTYITPSSSLSKNRLYEARQIDNLVNVSGAGDCFISGFISAILCGHSEELAINVACEAAMKSLKFKGAVPESFFDESDICWRKIAKHSNVF